MVAKMLYFVHPTCYVNTIREESCLGLSYSELLGGHEEGGATLKVCGRRALCKPFTRKMLPHMLHGVE